MTDQTTDQTTDQITYPSDASAATYLLTVRGRMTAASVEEARKIHNDTAGAPPSVAAARSLGDLSHNTFIGYGDGNRDELLFIDFWNSLSGLGRFFADPQVQAGAGLLFATRDNPVWAPAADFGSFHLAVPSGRAATGLGVIRSKITSVGAAASAFRAYADATVNTSRRHGIVSHSLFVKAAEPGAPAEPEIIGLDLWLDAAEMADYYELSLGFEHLGPAFAGAPDSTIWRAAPGGWTEW
jgi:hypothetical protein